MKGKFEEGVFPIDYMLKDLDLALSTGKSYGSPSLCSPFRPAICFRRASGESKKYHPAVIRPLEKLPGRGTEW